MVASFSRKSEQRSAKKVADDSAKIAELSAIIQAVRDRVRARYSEPHTNGATDSGAQRSLRSAFR